MYDFVRSGWPEDNNIPFYRNRNNFTVNRGILVFQTDYNRAVVPAVLRSKVLAMICMKIAGV